MFLIIFLSADILILMDLYLVMQMNASFHQRLEVLGPKINDLEYKELLASWASMHSREDYRKIITRMQGVAAQNGITLPKLLAEP